VLAARKSIESRAANAETKPNWGLAAAAVSLAVILGAVDIARDPSDVFICHRVRLLYTYHRLATLAKVTSPSAKVCP